MPTLAQPRLNRSFVLRYDYAHETDSVEGNDADAEFDAEIDAILVSKGITPNCGSPVCSGPEFTGPRCTGTENDHMDVNGISGVGRAQPLGGVRPAQDIETPATSALAPQDEVQISSAAQAMDELSQTANVRMERIQQIQQEIAEGVYDTDEKLDAALDRFLDAYGLSDD
ncbi:MAG: Anti-sigma-28 factor FlgM family protein [Planctomycetaceae bacterium]|nr:Anti-sigma-28 factor FlgM family protein [Planctomycetaceae bacterium]